MEFILVSLVAFSGALLSFFSGFGLGTLLLPVMMLFFPPEVAVAATAVVHMANNIFKFALMGRHTVWSVVWSFGCWSVVGAFAGAWALMKMAIQPAIYAYSIGSYHFEMTWVKWLIALVIVLFVSIERKGWLKKTSGNAVWMATGGVVSGFFGGFSGHQGAIRSAFLTNTGLTKEELIGTRASIAALVDTTRIFVYIETIALGWQSMNRAVLLVACMAAFSGAFLGTRWLKKTTSEFVERFISVSLILFSLLLAAGIV